MQTTERLQSLSASEKQRGAQSRSKLTAFGAIAVKEEMLSLHSRRLLCCGCSPSNQNGAA
jgi:hypothetical protein